ncbi:hypothetical protein [uncultured Bilophila sp.]|uniref:hypothetical protein n=1 Tax=uncultured Bilophila sp. TaxID=529385 RepID=UPI00266EE8F9|nr:hypothetical protein [uncultured Bilophila sp.]
MALSGHVAVSSPQRDENTAFLAFPLAESTAKAFCRLFLWSFKEKTSTIFYGAAKVFRLIKINNLNMI